MPKPTHILHWRIRRQNRSHRGGQSLRRSGCIAGLILLALVGAGIVASVVGATAVAALLTQDLPNITDLEKLGQDTSTTFETSKIYAWGDPKPDGHRDLVLIYEVIDPLGGDRQWLKLEQIPQSLIEATIAIEDQTFWDNPGYDMQGIGRAFYEFFLLGGDVQGGSSITQQLVKNTLITPDRRIIGDSVGWDDYRRKAEELILAQQITQTYSKEQILEWYLNTNFYGNLAYGIEAAARVYFAKSASELTLAEATLLAAIPQSPALNPIDDPVAAKERQTLVLTSLFDQGYISRDEMATAQFAPVQISPGIEERFDIIAPHFALYVRRQLEQMFGPELVLRGGLRVYTSLDLQMQRQAECVARAHVAQLSGQVGDLLPADELADCPALAFLPPQPTTNAGIDRQVNNAAVIALDPTTGEIRAMVGSLNYWNADIDGSFNVAVDGLRQPGSSFKPFAYLTALSQGYTAATMLLDVETDFGAITNGIPYVPQNYDRHFHGPMRLRQALGNSYNVPAVQITSWVGVEKVIRTAHSLGINSLDGSHTYGLSLPLGGGEVTLLDMAYAYSVMDNMGVMVGQPRPEAQQRSGYRTLDPVAILRVEDSQGTVLYEYSQPQRREILTPQLAYLMTDILSDRSARCVAFGCPNVLELPGNRPAAAKTGTTNDYRDDWTLGYTPQLVVGVWVGNTDNSPMDQVPGSQGAAPIWHALMSWALQSAPVQVWPQPPGLVEMAVCDISGLLPTPYCPTVSEYFIQGTQPTVYDNVYQEFAINRENGRLATLYTPPELIEQRIYKIYPEAAADWVRESEIEQPPTEYDTISVPPPGGEVAILTPRPFAYVQGLVTISGTVTLENFAYYRLAYFAGLTPTELRTVVEGVTQPVTNGPLATWDVENLHGLYTLLLTAVRQDGSFSEVSVPVTVDNTPPIATILFPLANQQVFTDEDWVIIQAQASDDLSLARVEFYADNAGVPFAISTVPPFTEKWPIRGAGCHTFRVVAVDVAGNETEGTAVPVCLLERP